MEVPLILTLAIEENAFQFFNALRKIYFPAERFYIDAHLTLFHLLPNDPLIVDTIASVSKEREILLLHVKEPAFIDNKVVFKIESEGLTQLHYRLQQQWQPFLIPEDRELLWPHITIQNKITPEAAEELLQFLIENFSSFHTIGTGLQLWEYDGGPWKLFSEFNFVKNEAK